MPTSPRTPSAAPAAAHAAGVSLRRVYEPPAPDDGYRVLVDRLWPRGLRRDDAAIDLWCKDIAPSPGLRTWFGHDPARWAQFQARYRDELDANPAAVERVATLCRAHGRLTLLIAARDAQHNHGLVLLDYLTRSAGGARPGAPEGASATQHASPQVPRLSAEHARMLDAMLRVRLALLAGDARRARESLDELAETHRAHAQLEEHELFTALPRAARWPRRVYEAEHARLVELLERLRQRLQPLPARLRDPRQRLALVDAALPLQHLLEHHFQREEQGLFVEVRAG